MDRPFFNSRRSSFQQPRYYDATFRPVERPQAGRSPKVVSIPVRFVDSVELDRPGSALKIQKMFRGFLVRRGVKKILVIKRELDQIESRISSSKVVALLSTDERERSRVTETLMYLICRLDSVRGVVNGVRECRKAMIRRAIALQEKVDAIVAVDAEVDQMAVQALEKNGVAADGSQLNVEFVSPETEHVRSDSQAWEQAIVGDKSPDDADQTMGKAADINEQNQADAERLEESVKEAEHPDEDVEINQGEVHETDRSENKLDLEIETNEDKKNIKSAELKSGFCCNEDEGLENQCGEDATLSHGEDSHSESQTDSSQSLIEGVEENTPHKDNGGAAVEQHQSNQVKDDKDGEEEGRSSSSNKELLAKMMEDNEKMMGLMAELFQRNKEQTRLMATLSQRVEQLERAFVCDKLRRKKKRFAGGHH